MLGRPLNPPPKTFHRILAAAGIENLRIHGLRHDFTSLGVNARVTYLLGPTSAQTTQRYAHLTGSTLR